MATKRKAQNPVISTQATPATSMPDNPVPTQTTADASTETPDFGSIVFQEAAIRPTTKRGIEARPNAFTPAVERAIALYREHPDPVNGAYRGVQLGVPFAQADAALKEIMREIRRHPEVTVCVRSGSEDQHTTIINLWARPKILKPRKAADTAVTA